MVHPLRPLLILLLLVGTPIPLRADMVGDGVVLHSERKGEALFDFDLRLPGGDAFTDLRVAVDRSEVTVAQAKLYPQAGDQTAILMLVDTSDPRRSAVVAEHIHQVRSLAALAKPHHRLGLARFDRDLEILAPLGSSPEVIRAGASHLKAGGVVTQLFRHSVAAVEMLAKEPASRRVLILFTDGLDEDRGFTRDHVVEAARKADVAVVGLGFSASAKGDVALQTLELMARDTGGYFAQSRDGMHLADDILAKAIVAGDGGGRFSLDLTPFRRTEPRTLQVEASLRQGGVVRTGRDMVLIPAFVSEAGDFFRVSMTLGVLLLSLWGWIKSRESKKAKAAALAVAPPPLVGPHASLEVEGEDGPWGQGMSGEIFIIGRNAAEGVDMALGHPTVSRPHAEIRHSGGGYRITNLSATNPLKVNGHAVDSGPLACGDEIVLGDIRLRFTAMKVSEAVRTRMVGGKASMPERTVLLRPDQKGD